MPSQCLREYLRVNWIGLKRSESADEAYTNLLASARIKLCVE